MKLPIILLPRAEFELADANSWYRTKSNVVAARFRATVRAAISDIQSAPMRWTIWRAPDFRRYLLLKFPYELMYRVLEREIVVVALMHQQQDVNARFPEDP